MATTDPTLRVGEDFLLFIAQTAAGPFVFLDGVTDYTRNTTSPETKTGVYGRSRKTSNFGQPEGSIDMTTAIPKSDPGHKILMATKRKGRGSTCVLRYVQGQDDAGVPTAYYDQAVHVGGGSHAPGGVDGVQTLKFTIAEDGEPFNVTGAVEIF